MVLGPQHNPFQTAPRVCFQMTPMPSVYKNLDTERARPPGTGRAGRCAGMRCSLTWPSPERKFERGGCSVGTAENKAVQRRIIDGVINRKYLSLANELFSEEHELHPN